MSEERKRTYPANRKSRKPGAKQTRWDPAMVAMLYDCIERYGDLEDFYRGQGYRDSKSRFWTAVAAAMYPAYTLTSKACRERFRLEEKKKKGNGKAEEDSEDLSIVGSVTLVQVMAAITPEIKQLNLRLQEVAEKLEEIHRFAISESILFKFQSLPKITEKIDDVLTHLTDPD